MNIEKVAKILNLLNKQSTDRIIDYIGHRDASLAKELLAQLFRFEDLHKLPDRDLTILLQEIPKPLLPIALKGEDKQFVAKFVNNLSKRAGEVLKEELAMLPPRPKSEVVEAQRAITAVARMLVEQEKIFAPWLHKDNEIIY
jgi:flagellar motor switch protein FliG